MQSRRVYTTRTFNVYLFFIQNHLETVDKVPRFMLFLCTQIWKFSFCFVSKRMKIKFRCEQHSRGRFGGHGAFCCPFSDRDIIRIFYEWVCIPGICCTNVNGGNKGLPPDAITRKRKQKFYCLANVIKQITTQLTKVFNQSFLRELQLNNYLTAWTGY